MKVIRVLERFAFILLLCLGDAAATSPQTVVSLSSNSSNILKSSLEADEFNILNFSKTNTSTNGGHLNILHSNNPIMNVMPLNEGVQQTDSYAQPDDRPDGHAAYQRTTKYFNVSDYQRDAEMSALSTPLQRATENFDPTLLSAVHDKTDKNGLSVKHDSIVGKLKENIQEASNNSLPVASTNRKLARALPSLVITDSLTAHKFANQTRPESSEISERIDHQAHHFSSQNTGIIHTSLGNTAEESLSSNRLTNLPQRLLTSVSKETGMIRFPDSDVNEKHNSVRGLNQVTVQKLNPINFKPECQRPSANGFTPSKEIIVVKNTNILNNIPSITDNNENSANVLIPPEIHTRVLDANSNLQFATYHKGNPNSSDNFGPLQGNIYHPNYQLGSTLINWPISKPSSVTNSTLSDALSENMEKSTSRFVKSSTYTHLPTTTIRNYGLNSSYAGHRVGGQSEHEVLNPWLYRFPPWFEPHNPPPPGTQVSQTNLHGIDGDIHVDLTELGGKHPMFWDKLINVRVPGFSNHKKEVVRTVMEANLRHIAHDNVVSPRTMTEISSESIAPRTVGSGEITSRVDTFQADSDDLTQSDKQRALSPKLNSTRIVDKILGDVDLPDFANTTEEKSSFVRDNNNFNENGEKTLLETDLLNKLVHEQKTNSDNASGNHSSNNVRKYSRTENNSEYNKIPDFNKGEYKQAKNETSFNFAIQIDKNPSEETKVDTSDVTRFHDKTNIQHVTNKIPNYIKRDSHKSLPENLHSHENSAEMKKLWKHSASGKDKIDSNYNESNFKSISLSNDPQIDADTSHITRNNKPNEKSKKFLDPFDQIEKSVHNFKKTDLSHKIQSDVDSNASERELRDGYEDKETLTPYQAEIINAAENKGEDLFDTMSENTHVRSQEVNENYDSDTQPVPYYKNGNTNFEKYQEDDVSEPENLHDNVSLNSNYSNGYNSDLYREDYSPKSPTEYKANYYDDEQTPNDADHGHHYGNHEHVQDLGDTYNQVNEDDGLYQEYGTGSIGPYENGKYHSHELSDMPKYAESFGYENKGNAYDSPSYLEDITSYEDDADYQDHQTYDNGNNYEGTEPNDANLHSPDYRGHDDSENGDDSYLYDSNKLSNPGPSENYRDGKIISNSPELHGFFKPSAFDPTIYAINQITTQRPYTTPYTTTYTTTTTIPADVKSHRPYVHIPFILRPLILGTHLLRAYYRPVIPQSRPKYKSLASNKPSGKPFLPSVLISTKTPVYTSQLNSGLRSQPKLPGRTNVVHKRYPFDYWIPNKINFSNNLYQDDDSSASFSNYSPKFLFSNMNVTEDKDHNVTSFFDLNSVEMTKPTKAFVTREVSSKPKQYLRTAGRDLQSSKIPSSKLNFDRAVPSSNAKSRDNSSNGLWIPSLKPQASNSLKAPVLSGTDFGSDIKPFQESSGAVIKNDKIVSTLPRPTSTDESASVTPPSHSQHKQISIRSTTRDAPRRQVTSGVPDLKRVKSHSQQVSILQDPMLLRRLQLRAAGSSHRDSGTRRNWQWPVS